MAYGTLSRRSGGFTLPKWLKPRKSAIKRRNSRTSLKGGKRTKSRSKKSKRGKSGRRKTFRRKMSYF